MRAAELAKLAWLFVVGGGLVVAVVIPCAVVLLAADNCGE